MQTEAASAVTQTAATLHAGVNPNEGGVSDCHFEYGTGPTYGHTAPCSSSPGSGAAPVAVSAAVAALSANSTYHFRIVAANAGGTSQGADRTFTTLPEAPAGQTEAASAVTQTTATLNAGVNPNEGEVSDCHFEYGSSVFYEASQPCGQGSIAGGAPVEVSGALMDLTPQTTYHFRIVAANAGGTGQGADRMFTTLPEAPVITALRPASGAQAGTDTVTISGANLGGASAVRFGENDVRSFSVESPSSISAVTPAGTGTVDVIVMTPGGTSAVSPADRFTYLPPPTVSKVVPRSGPVGGGTAVSIAGANLGARAA